MYLLNSNNFNRCGFRSIKFMRTPARICIAIISSSIFACRKLHHICEFWMVGHLDSNTINYGKAFSKEIFNYWLWGRRIKYWQNTGWDIITLSITLTNINNDKNSKTKKKQVKRKMKLSKFVDASLWFGCIYFVSLKLYSSECVKWK